MSFLKSRWISHRFGSPLRVTCPVVAILAASHAGATWSTVLMHPPEYSESRVWGSSGSRQGGFARVGNLAHAGWWSGNAASWIDLHPASASESMVYSTDGSIQAGYARISNVFRACLWTGDAGSRVDLHPTGASQSFAYAAGGGKQGGSVATNMIRASLWSGVANGWIDLSPSGSTHAEVRAISPDGSRQGGFARFLGVFRAGFWAGSAGSWIDLHPSGSFESSQVSAIDNSSQAGSVTEAGTGRTRASLWNGDTDLRIDLNPSGAIFSSVQGVGDGMQVGIATVGGVVRASLWTGTADSWEDLHTYLPAGYSGSHAYGIASDGVNYLVAGLAVNAATGKSEAVLWKRPIPAPGSAVLAGLAGLAAVRRRAR